MDGVQSGVLEGDGSGDKADKLQLATKGGKQNISVGEFNRHSKPADVEKAMNEAKKAGKESHYKKLKGLLKVIKRGGRGIGPVSPLPNLFDIVSPPTELPAIECPGVVTENGCFI